jgi:hypothetical protein
MAKTSNQKNLSIDVVHQSTVDRLSPVERHFCEMLVKEGSLKVVPDEVTV